MIRHGFFYGSVMNSNLYQHFNLASYKYFILKSIIFGANIILLY